jgi:hypothetical protein
MEFHHNWCFFVALRSLSSKPSHRLCCRACAGLASDVHELVVAQRIGSRQPLDLRLRFPLFARLVVRVVRGQLLQAMQAIGN